MFLSGYVGKYSEPKGSKSLIFKKKSFQNPQVPNPSGVPSSCETDFSGEVEVSKHRGVRCFTKKNRETRCLELQMSPANSLSMLKVKIHNMESVAIS